MSYQLPLDSKSLLLLGETIVPMYIIKPTEILKPNCVIVTMFINGHIGSDFKMRINLYADNNGDKLLISSTPINNLDIVRSGSYYVDLRFDFDSPARLAVGHEYLASFEIYDGYTEDINNSVSLIMDTQAALGYVGSDVIDLALASTLSFKCSFFLELIQTQLEDQFFMARLQCGRLLNNDFTESTPYMSGKLDVAYLPSGMVIKEMVATSAGADAVRVRVGTLAEVTNAIFNYHYDVDTGVLTYYSGTIYSATSFVILEFYLFFTEFIGRYAPLGISSGATVYWGPRLNSGIEFDFSQKNNTSGVMSVASSAISLKNHDLFFNDFFRVNSSFNNREALIWRCQGNVSSYRLEFIGTIKEASINDSECSFTLNDITAALDSSYSDSDFLTYDDTSYAIREDDKKTIVPRLFGNTGPFEQEYVTTSQDTKIRLPNGEKMTSLVCVNYNPNSKTTSTNRLWSIGFGPSSAGAISFDVLTHSHGTAGTFSYSIIDIDPGTDNVNDLFTIGSTFKMGTQYGTIFGTLPSADRLYVWPYNASLSAVDDIFRQRVDHLIITSSGVRYLLMPFRDYTCSIGADGDVHVTLVNNFEANHSGLGTLDPDTMTMVGRLWGDGTNKKASEIAKSIIALTALNPSASFSPAGSWIDPQLSFTVPYVGTNSMPTYRDILERILKSSMSFIYFDELGEVRYKSFLHWDGSTTTPSDISSIVNESGQLPADGFTQKNSTGFQVSLDLFDSFTGVDFDFTHNQMLIDANAATLGLTSSSGLLIAQKLYKTNKRYQVESLVDQNMTGFGSYIAAYVKLIIGRKATYTVEGFSDRFGIYIGDDLLIARTKLIGGDNSVPMRVVSMSKGVANSKLELIDMRIFPCLP